MMLSFNNFTEIGALNIWMMKLVSIFIIVPFILQAVCNSSTISLSIESLTKLSVAKMCEPFNTFGFMANGRQARNSEEAAMIILASSLSNFYMAGYAV